MSSTKNVDENFSGAELNDIEYILIQEAVNTGKKI